jgi:hypothetical protein
MKLLTLGAEYRMFIRQHDRDDLVVQTFAPMMIYCGA